MPDYQVIWLNGALEDIVRHRRFLGNKNPKAARELADLLEASGNSLSLFPERGVPVNKRLDYKDLIIPYGKGSYTMRYRIVGQKVVIAMIKHARENTFKRKHQ